MLARAAGVPAGKNLATPKVGLPDTMSKSVLVGLAGEGLHASEEWLEALGAFARENCLAGAELAAFARSQFLAADLRDMGAARLPDLFADQTHGTVIAGPVCVQLEAWRQVSQPQAQASGLVDVAEQEQHEAELMGLRRQNVDDDDNDGSGRPGQSGRRMLKLQCTDGHQEVYLFEYRPVGSALHSLVPGTKLLLRNVRVLRGLLALQPGCVTVLGGGRVPESESDPEPAANNDNNVGNAEMKYSGDLGGEDDFDLAAIEALERAALAARVRVKPEPVISQPVPSASSSSSAAKKKKGKRRKYLDDSE